MNADNFCEEIVPAYCESAEYFNGGKFYLSPEYVYSIYYGNKGVGCNKCRAGFVGVYSDRSVFNPVVCSEISLLHSPEALPDNSFYIKNCQNYAFEDGEVYCMTCNSEYVINENNNLCHRGPIGCKISAGDTACRVCLEDRYLVNGLCESSNIPFCKIPEFENNNTN